MSDPLYRFRGWPDSEMLPVYERDEQTERHARIGKAVELALDGDGLSSASVVADLRLRARAQRSQKHNSTANLLNAIADALETES